MKECSASVWISMSEYGCINSIKKIGAEIKHIDSILENVKWLLVHADLAERRSQLVLDLQRLAVELSGIREVV